MAEITASTFHRRTALLLLALLVKVEAVIIIYGPLTTTFTPSRSCFDTTAFDPHFFDGTVTGRPSSALSFSTYEIKLGLAIADDDKYVSNNPATTDCYPEYYRRDNAGGYFSPGLACPVGYTTAQIGTDSSNTLAMCCPTGYDPTLLYGSCVSRPSFDEAINISAVIVPADFPDGSTVVTSNSLFGVEASYKNGYFDVIATPIQLMWNSNDLNTTSTLPRSTSTPVITNPPTLGPVTTSSGISQGAKIGLGVGVPLVVLSILGCCMSYMLFRRRRRLQKQQAPHSEFNELQGTTALHELHDKPAKYQLQAKQISQELQADTPVIHELDAGMDTIGLDAESKHVDDETPRPAELPELPELPAPPAIHDRQRVASEMENASHPHTQLSPDPESEQANFEGGSVSDVRSGLLAEPNAGTTSAQALTPSIEPTGAISKPRSRSGSGEHEHKEELSCLDDEEEQIRSRNAKQVQD